MNAEAEGRAWERDDGLKLLASEYYIYRLCQVGSSFERKRKKKVPRAAIKNFAVHIRLLI